MSYEKLVITIDNFIDFCEKCSFIWESGDMNRDKISQCILSTQEPIAIYNTPCMSSTQ